MRQTFILIASLQNREAFSPHGHVTYGAEVRLEVSAKNLSDAYKVARKLPEMRQAHLRPERA